MKKTQSLAVAALLCGASVAQATIIQPTNENVNFSMIDDYTLAIFDDADRELNSALVVDMQYSPYIDRYTGSVRFSPWSEVSGTTYSVSNGTTSLGLGETTDFFIALYDAAHSMWVTDSAYTELNGSFSLVEFKLGQVCFPETEEIVTVDMETSPVPIPAAAWLFSTGLIGLAGVARRSAA